MSEIGRNKENEPLRPIPFEELDRMLFGIIPKMKPKEDESPNSEASVSARSLYHAELNTKPYLEINSPTAHFQDMSVNPENAEFQDSFYNRNIPESCTKENVYSFNNDSGYSSTTNRTNATVNTAEVMFPVFLPQQAKSEYIDIRTPRNHFANGTAEVKFSKFVVPHSIKSELKVPRTTPSTANKDKVVFQYTPSQKPSRIKAIRKPLFIRNADTNLNNNSNGSLNEFNMKSLPVVLEDIISTSANLSINTEYESITVNKCKYFKGNMIGKGGSSEVYQCYDPVQKSLRAIKIVDLKQNEESSTQYRNEVKVLQDLQESSRVIRLYDYEIAESEAVLYMVLEMGGKDIDKILKQLSSRTAPLPVYMILYYWMEMLYCVRDIHNKGIVHSDLKPANFLMAENGIKLIDFGIASHLQTDMTSVVRTSAVGSLNYISPEALKCDDITAKYKIKINSDVWSLGCILYQLVYKKAPFQHIANMWKKILVISDANHKIDYPPADWVPQKILKTIKDCLQFNANLRPSIEDLIADYELCNFS